MTDTTVFPPTGKLGIDVERKMVIDTDKDKDLWVTTVDPQDIAEARKFSSPERQVRAERDTI